MKSLFSVVLDLAKLQKSSDNMEIEMEIEPGLDDQGNREGLQQVLLNCVLNAMDAIEARRIRSTGADIINVRRKKQIILILIYDQA